MSPGLSVLVPGVIGPVFPGSGTNVGPDSLGLVAPFPLQATIPAILNIAIYKITAITREVLRIFVLIIINSLNFIYMASPSILL